jgi:hypothetical protein
MQKLWKNKENRKRKEEKRKRRKKYKIALGEPFGPPPESAHGPTKQILKRRLLLSSPCWQVGPTPPRRHQPLAGFFSRRHRDPPHQFACFLASLDSLLRLFKPLPILYISPLLSPPETPSGRRICSSESAVPEDDPDLSLWPHSPYPTLAHHLMPSACPNS